MLPKGSQSRSKSGKCHVFGTSQPNILARCANTTFLHCLKLHWSMIDLYLSANAADVPRKNNVCKLNSLGRLSGQMKSNLAQHGSNNVGGNQANDKGEDEVPEQDEAGGGDGGVQQHLGGDQRLPLHASRAPNICMFLKYPVRRNKESTSCINQAGFHSDSCKSRY